MSYEGINSKEPVYRSWICDSGDVLLQYLSQPAHLHPAIRCRETLIGRVRAEDHSQVQESTSVEHELTQRY